jgi:hypothetical protein
MLPDLLLRWFHSQHIVDPIEVIEESNRGHEFNNLAFVKVFTQVGPAGVVERMWVAGLDFSQTQCSFFPIIKIVAGLEICQMFDLIVAPAEPPCQDGM